MVKQYHWPYQTTPQQKACENVNRIYKKTKTSIYLLLSPLTGALDHGFMTIIQQAGYNPPLRNESFISHLKTGPFITF